MPAISIIITLYNKSKYILECVKSILNGTFKDIEIIVVEDCSTDNSKEIIKKAIINNPNANIKLIENKKNVGAGMSRQIGIENASGEWISLIDADDYLEPDYYETLLNYQKKSNADAVFSRVKIEKIDSDGNLSIEEDNEHYNDEVVITDKYMMMNNFSLLGLQFLGHALIRKELYQKIGGYCRERLIEDTPTMVSLMNVINAVHITPYFGYIYRVLPDSLIHSAKKLEREYWLYYSIMNSIKYIEQSDKKFADYIKSSMTCQFFRSYKNYDDLKDIDKFGADEIIKFYSLDTYLKH